MNRRLVLLAASQDLTACPRALAWMDRHLQALMLELHRDETVVLITGGAAGAECWAEALAATFGVRSVAYLPTGARRVDGRASEPWAELASGSGATARRDRVLIETAQQRQQQGDQVEMVALLRADASPRSSSLQRAALAQMAGLRVRREVWGKARRLAVAS